MQQYTISQVCEIVSGKLYAEGLPSVISDLITDSRKVATPTNALFFALITQRNDGHRFIGELIEKGVGNFCVQYIPDGLSAKANFIVVGNTLIALQQLAARHRDQYNPEVIGITGSNGKTVVKEWLWQLLNQEKTIVRSPQSYNSQTGVPLSVWQINSLHNLGIFEAGISQPGEMEKLEPIIKPDIGIITNIGKAHDQFFISHDEKTTEKLKLFKNSQHLIYCRDHEIIHYHVKALPLLKLHWGRHEESNIRIIETKTDRKSTHITVQFNQKHFSITIPFTDEASFENAMHCMSLMLFLGYGPEVIRSRMAMLQPVAMRLELKEGVNGCLIINDTYSNDPDSLAIALDFLKQQSQHEKRTVIISDMLQSGTPAEQLYTTIASLLVSKGITRVIGIGNDISQHIRLFPMKTETYASTTDFLSSFSALSFRNETILIKGARVFAFERIQALLEQKSHETILEVNLNALIHNLNYFRTLIKPGTRIMAMVKAFSYGSGSFEIANALQFHHTDYLAVAYADEGVELRKAGISLPIMVMNPEISGMEAMVRYNLEPEIYSIRTLQLYLKALERTTPSSAPVHIKLDTGMHRLGFMENDLAELAEVLKQNPAVRVESAFSHLAASESPELDSFTAKQISAFERMTDRLQQETGYPFIRHILNSAGIIRHPHAQYEMVRLGISLYGISPVKDVSDKLEIVNSLKSSISQIKVIAAGESVGYNCRWTASKETTIAIVPIGYADGLGRQLGNGAGSMWIKGTIAPIIGNINMDMTVIDVTGLDAEEGDEVVIFGKEISISDLAEIMHTIPYEILTGISRRVKRIYYQE